VRLAHVQLVQHLALFTLIPEISSILREGTLELRIILILNIVLVYPPGENYDNDYKQLIMN
jgi:hypothetical protein